MHIHLGVYAAKLDVSIVCRQMVASIGCSIIPCIKSISISCDHLKQKKDASIFAAKLNNFFGCIQVLVAALFPASKICPVPAIIVFKQQWLDAFLQPSCMQVLDEDIFLQVLDAASVHASNKY